MDEPTGAGRLRAWIELNGVGQRELARRVGCSQSLLSKLTREPERGIKASLAILLELATSYVDERDRTRVDPVQVYDWLHPDDVLTFGKLRHTLSRIDRRSPGLARKRLERAVDRHLDAQDEANLALQEADALLATLERIGESLKLPDLPLEGREALLESASEIAQELEARMASTRVDDNGA